MPGAAERVRDRRVQFGWIQRDIRSSPVHATTEIALRSEISCREIAQS